LNGNPIANLVLHITQLHCPVNANTITERIGNISEVFATVFAKQCNGDIGMLGLNLCQHQKDVV
jgi:hypothetical protein